MLPEAPAGGAEPCPPVQEQRDTGPQGERVSPSGPREDRRTHARIARLLFAVLALPQEQQSVIAPCLSLQGGGDAAGGATAGSKEHLCWAW